jgi:hypothetical protein
VPNTPDRRLSLVNNVTHRENAVVYRFFLPKVTCAVRESNPGRLIHSPTLYLLSYPDSYVYSDFHAIYTVVICKDACNKENLDNYFLIYINIFLNHHNFKEFKISDPKADLDIYINIFLIHLVIINAKIIIKKLINFLGMNAKIYFILCVYKSEAIFMQGSSIT